MTFSSANQQTMKIQMRCLFNEFQGKYMDNKQFLNIEELSQYLNIKKSTLYSWVSQGEIPHHKIGHLVRFNKEAIDEWLSQSRRAIDQEDINKKVQSIINQAKSKEIDIEKIIEQAKGSR